jgi:hypothetical protein
MSNSLSRIISQTPLFREDFSISFRFAGYDEDEIEVVRREDTLSIKAFSETLNESFVTSYWIPDREYESEFEKTFSKCCLYITIRKRNGRN